MKKLLFTVLLMGFIIANVITAKSVKVEADDDSLASVQLVQYNDIPAQGGTSNTIWQPEFPSDLSDFHIGPLSGTTFPDGIEFSRSGQGYTITVSQGTPVPSSPIDAYVFLDNGIRITGTPNASCNVRPATDSSIQVTFDPAKCIENINTATGAVIQLKWEVNDNNIGNWIYTDPSHYTVRVQELNRYGITAVFNQIAGDVIEITPNYNVALATGSDSPIGNNIYEPEYGEILYYHFRFTFSYTPFDGDIFCSNGAKIVSEETNTITYDGVLYIWPALKYGTDIPAGFQVKVLSENSDTWLSVTPDSEGKYLIAEGESNPRVEVSATGYQARNFTIASNPFGLNLSVSGSGRNKSVTASIKNNSSHNIKCWVFNNETVKIASQINTDGYIGNYRRALWILNTYETGDTESLSDMKLVFQNGTANSLNFSFGAPNETKDYIIIAIADPNEGESGKAFGYYTFHTVAETVSYTYVPSYDYVPSYNYVPSSDTETSSGKSRLKTITDIEEDEPRIKYIDISELMIETLTITTEVLSENTGKDIIGTEAKLSNIVKNVDFDSEKGVFKKNGRIITNSFLKDEDDNIYYTDENGKPVTDMIVTNGEKSYYFGKDGKVLRNGVITLDNGEKMVTGNKGSLKTGENKKVIIADKDYLLKENGYLAQNEFVTNKSGKTYYAGKDGVVKVGVFKVSGIRYVTNTAGVIQKNTITKCNGKMYFSESDGSVRINKTFSWQGVTYKADKNGQLTVIRGK